MAEASELPAEDRAAPERGPDATLHAAVLFGAAAVVALGLPLVPEGSRPWVVLFAGCSSAVTLAVFALRHARAQRERVGSSGKPAAGGIRERRTGSGAVVLDLPGQGLEPWGSDAWSILLATVTLVGLGLAFDSGSWALFAFVPALALALGLRLLSAPRDFIRIELEASGWSIDAFEGGRTVHCRGTGALLPELLPEALLLWSDQGRIGTIRWELRPEERAWLAARLGEWAEATPSLAEAYDQVKEAETHEDGQEQKAEQAE